MLTLLILRQYSSELVPDPEVEQNPESFYDEAIEIDLSSLEPYVVGPHSPDLRVTCVCISRRNRRKGLPINISLFGGSCTNSS